MLTIEKPLFPKKEFQYIMEVLYLDIGLKKISLENNILILVKVRNISHNEVFVLFPCYTKIIFPHINFSGGLVKVISFWTN